MPHIKGGTLKPPVKSGDNPRRASFCLLEWATMKGPERDAKGKPTRLLLSLRAWGASSKADARAKARAISKRNKAKKSLKDKLNQLEKERAMPYHTMKKGTAKKKTNGGLTKKQEDTSCKSAEKNYGF